MLSEKNSKMLYILQFYFYIFEMTKFKIDGRLHFARRQACGPGTGINIEYPCGIGTVQFSDSGGEYTKLLG